ncbi:hypothetical protein ABFW11_19410, partial [Mycolicibacterium porcinum]
MAKNSIKVSANVADTVRPTIAGAARRPGWNVLRRVVGQVTTPLLPDDYLKLANPGGSAARPAGRGCGVRRETSAPGPWVRRPGGGVSCGGGAPQAGGG